MKNKVELSQVLNDAVYANAKAQLKAALAKRCGATSISQLTMTKVTSSSMRVCVSGKPRAYLSMDSDLQIIEGAVTGACMMQMVGSATKQLIKISAPLAVSEVKVVKSTERTGWSLQLLIALTVGLGSITAAVAATVGVL